MPVVAYATHKEVNFAVGTNFFFITATFCVNIRRITIEQVDIFCGNINVIEKVAVHKAVVALRVLFWQTNIFVHVKGHDVLEADLARFMHFNQRFVGGKRRAAGGQAKNKRTIRSGFERIDAVNDMAGGPFTDLFGTRQGDQSHCLPLHSVKLTLANCCLYALSVTQIAP